MADIDELNLTPQEQFLYKLHRINLLNAPVHNPDNSISTLRQMTIGGDDKTYSIPTVWDGAVLEPDKAIARAKSYGLDAFPSYPTRAEAQSRYDQMHGFMDKEAGQASKAPQDIYPLGQGKGLLTDIINFGLNNLNKYGAKTADYHANLTKAFQDIQSGKSPDLSPLIQDAISVNPVMAGTWGPVRTAAQKKAVKAMWRADPEAVKAIATDPRELNLSGLADIRNRGRLQKLQGDLMTEGFIPEGASATFTPSKDVIKVAPASMRGSAYFQGRPGGFMGLVPEKPAEYLTGSVNLPESMGHEAQHFLNVPRVYGSDISNEAATRMYGQLRPYLSEHAQKGALEGGIKNVDPKVALDEALSYLSMPSNRKGEAAAALHELLKVKPGEQGTTRGLNLTPEVLQSAIARSEAVGKNPAPGMISRIWQRMMGTAPSGERAVSFNKFGSEGIEGKDVLNKMYQQMENKEGRPGYALSMGKEGPPLSRDQFLESILQDIGWAGAGSKNLTAGSGVGQGLTQLRRNMGETWNVRRTPQEMAAILQHLDKNGLLTQDVIQNAMDRHLAKYGGEEVKLDPKVFGRIKRFAEESGSK